MKKMGLPVPSAHRTKKEESSEDDVSTNGGETSSKTASKGISAMSLPATSGFSGAYYTKGGVTTLTKPVTAAAPADDKSTTSGEGAAKDPSSFSQSGFYYGSIGAIPTQLSSSFAHKPAGPLSFQPQYMNNAPPYARRSGHHRGHTRTSSLSSSYTRSSVRGGADEDDEDDLDDIGYLDKGSLYGSLTSMSSPSVAAPYHGKKGRNVSGSGEDYEFDVLDERDEREDEDTVDEESDENHGIGGAGMEIDMEL